MLALTIELLKEKRQAVISHAVTKGLDPDVAIKDSGVEWLGEVPKHWSTGALKRFWKVIDCKHLTAEFVEDGYPLASIREVQSRYVDLSEAKKTTQFYYSKLIGEGRRPENGDLVVSRNATVGEVAEVTDGHPPFAMGQDVSLLKKADEKSFSSKYFYYLLKAVCITEQISALLVGSTFKRINVEEICNLSVPMPPFKEQKLLTDFIEQKATHFDSLVAEAERGINLFRERRSALVSAAVTGKIDIRGWEPPVSEIFPRSTVNEDTPA